MADQLPLATAAITAGVAAISAIAGVIITFVLTRRREHEADWRKLKLGQYQEFVLALSGIVRGRATPEAHSHYADAVNSMSLVGTIEVLTALRKFQDEIAWVNQNNRKTDDRHDELLAQLLRAMRKDINPQRSRGDEAYPFRLLGLPPEATRSEAP